MNNVVLSFFQVGLDEGIKKRLGRLLAEIALNFTYKEYLENPRDIPKVLLEEMQGIVKGCQKANPDTEVTFKKMLCLNAGIDTVMSVLYPSDGFKEALEDLLGLKVDKRVTAVEKALMNAAVVAAATLLPKLEEAGEYFRIPIMCNGMSVFGDATADGKHYFGRDFMFPTAGVYQDTACMIIYNPAPRRFWNRVRKPLPFVAVTAPGLVGCMTAMNVNGVAFGVHIAPGGNCNPLRPGLNSLLIGRHCIERGKDAEKAVKAITDVQRGVAWIYFVADGTEGNDRAAVVEAGMTAGELDYLGYPQKDLRGLLPPRNELQQANRGVIVRWDDYQYNEGFFKKYNDRLFNKFKKQFVLQDFERNECINIKWDDQKVPKAYYFAPKRTGKPGVIIATNHFITPEMRLCAMDPWTAEVTGEKRYNDIQWRYDELNKRVMDAYGKINFDKAKELIDFLAPCPKERPFRKYYEREGHGKSSDGKSYVIDGSVSVCNLTDRVIESYFGYYGDEWVQITLGEYVG
jgi:hypothetical protein